MTDINEQCWGVIGALGSDDGSNLPVAAVERLTNLGLVEASTDGAPSLTVDGERAYIVLESGDGEVPGLE
jgi:hypothetical protein